MKDMPLKLAVRGQMVKLSLNDVGRKLRSDEQGELGSWLILAAGLAIAAGAAVTALTPWFEGKVSDITGN